MTLRATELMPVAFQPWAWSGRSVRQTSAPLRPADPAPATFRPRVPVASLAWVLLKVAMSRQAAEPLGRTGWVLRQAAVAIRAAALPSRARYA